MDWETEYLKFKIIGMNMVTFKGLWFSAYNMSYGQTIVLGSTYCILTSNSAVKLGYIYTLWYSPTVIMLCLEWKAEMGFYPCGAEVGVKVDIVIEVYFKGLLGLPFTCLLVRQMVH